MSYLCLNLCKYLRGSVDTLSKREEKRVRYFHHISFCCLKSRTLYYGGNLLKTWTVKDINNASSPYSAPYEAPVCMGPQHFILNPLHFPLMPSPWWPQVTLHFTATVGFGAPGLSPCSWMTHWAPQTTWQCVVLIHFFPCEPLLPLWAFPGLSAGIIDHSA